VLNKLLANLPFNPGLVNQVAFYGRRLRAESSIRRLGFAFAGLALFVQVIAVISAPPLAQASQPNDLINGGISSAAQAYTDCQQNVQSYGTILNSYGITCADVKNAPTTSIHSTDHGKNLYSMGRQPANKAGETTQNINNAPAPGPNPYYWRFLWSWDTTSTPSLYTALEINISGRSTPFYIIYKCGNLVSVGIPTPIPTPTPATTSANISGTVYYYNGTTSSPISGMQVYNGYNSVTNEPASMITNGSGQFSFSIPVGTGFYVRAGNPSSPYVWVASNGVTYSDPVITPGYAKPNAPPPGVALNCNGNTSSYELQVAGTTKSTGSCNYGLATDGGYNITFTKETTPSATTSANISGTVYYYNGTTSSPISGMQVYNGYNSVTNEPASMITNGSGQFSFSIPVGTGFYVRAGNPSSPYVWVASNGVTYSDPVITPGYAKPNAPPPGVALNCNGNTSSYELQVAGTTKSTGSCNYGLATDGGYNITFTKETTPKPTTTTTPTPTTTTTPTPTTTTTPTPTPTPTTTTTPTPCEYNTSISSTDSQCKPCISSETQSDILDCLSYSKSASNVTENISNANGTTAQAGDVIQYTLSVNNSAKATAKAFVIQEVLSNVLDYATPQNLNGGTIDASTNILSWPAVDISAGATVQKTFTVQIDNPIPTTLPSPSNPGAFNHTLTNTYGNTVVINLPIPIALASAQVAQALPNTGPGSSLIIAGAIMIVIGYFFARSRLLAKEAAMVSSDFITVGKV
jgi:hypothetical protein